MAKQKEEFVTIVGQRYENGVVSDQRNGIKMKVEDVQLIIDAKSRNYLAHSTVTNVTLVITRKEYKRVEDLIVKIIFN